LARLDEGIDGLSDEIEALTHQDKGCERLMTVPGIGGCIRSRSAGWMRRCGSW
jgi:transposase